MFVHQYTAETLTQALLPRAAYHPFPTAAERAPWEALAPAMRDALLAHGTAAQQRPWPALPATLYLDFTRTGNRVRFERPYFKRRQLLGALAVAECVEGQGRFMDALIDALWGMCEESTWVFPAHSYSHPFSIFDPLPNPDYALIDLFAAETGALLSWVHYLLRDRLDAITPYLSARVRREVQARILDPFLTQTDYWWMGLSHDRPVNNWAPWCTSNCLSALLLLEDDPARRVQATAKALAILDRFVDGYHADGGCDEGPGYWNQAGASLFDCLELLHGVTQGVIDVYQEPLIQEIGRYLYRVHVGGDYFINFADSSARVQVAAELVHRYGQRIGDARLRALGVEMYHQQRQQLRPAEWYPLFRVLPAIFNDATLRQEPPATALVRDAWLPGIQLLAAREHATTAGLYLAAKGGHNQESHNHNDIGQFIVYANGYPAIIDAGVGSYTLKTFSPQRYEIWTMQSAYHNLPTVNGAQQLPGEQYRATEVACTADEAGAALSLAIAAAYPPEAGVTTWRRTCRLVRGAEARVEIVDDFQLTQPTAAVVMSLMVPCPPDLTEAGVIRLPLADDTTVTLAYDGTMLTPTAERLPIDDARMSPVWGEAIYRVQLRATAAVAQGRWVMAITL